MVLFFCLPLYTGNRWLYTFYMYWLIIHLLQHLKQSEINFTLPTAKTQKRWEKIWQIFNYKQFFCFWTFDRGVFDGIGKKDMSLEKACKIFPQNSQNLLEEHAPLSPETKYRYIWLMFAMVVPIYHRSSFSLQKVVFLYIMNKIWSCML